MYAVIKSGGKQHHVKKGERLKLESLSADVGETVSIDKVLLTGDGEDIKVGTPYIDGVTVTAEVLAHGRGKKVKVIKMHRRKDYHRAQGHRQNYTEIKITDILGV